MHSGRRSIYCGLAALALASGAGAQWATQTNDLSAGWNAVFLQVQPEPADCEAVFAAISNQVLSVCGYVQTFSPVQFIQDISEEALASRAWLIWRPGSALDNRSLFQMQAGRGYLVHTKAACSLRIRGRVVLKPLDWRPGAYNLVGFSIAPSNRPSVATFFAPAGSAIDTNQVYGLLPTGTWAKVSGTLANGAAYWVKATASTRYQGPAVAETSWERGLDFGADLMELPLMLRNETASNAVFTLRALPSEVPPANHDDYASWAGGVPLSWLNPDSTNSAIGGWEIFPSNGLQRTVSAGTNLSVRLAVRRRHFAPFTPPAGKKSQYASVVEVTSTRGTRHLVPVTALGEALTTNFTGLAAGRTGLWLGDVVIDKVSLPQGEGKTADPVPVGQGNEFGLRVILHNGTNGVVNLLQHVAVVWKDGSYGPPTNAAGYRNVLEPGRYMLVTDDAQLPSFANQSGDGQGLRLSSSAFSLRAPSPAAGSTTNSLRFAVRVAHDDPLSPYLHRYHPDHNNMGGENIQKYALSSSVVSRAASLTNRLGNVWTTNVTLSSTAENFTVVRLIEMEFSDVVDEASPAWGDTILGGVWRERILGLHAEPINVEGRFLIKRVSGVGALNL